jgi:hypothetical protein
MPFVGGPIAAALVVCLLGMLADSAVAQEDVTAGQLYDECRGYASGDGPASDKIACENTIRATFKTVEAAKKLNAEYTPPYCQPAGTVITTRQTVALFLGYMDRSPAARGEPAEQAVLQALADLYRCGG